MENRNHEEVLPDLNIFEADKGIRIFLFEIEKRIMLTKKLIKNNNLKGIAPVEAKILLNNLEDDYKKFEQSADKLSSFLEENI